MDTVIITPALAIPLSEISFTAARSGGPGGQHVNTTSSKVLLAFDVAGSPSLSEFQKRRVMERLAGRIDSQGVMQLSCSEERSQHRNKALCLERFAALLAEALRPRPPRLKTRPTKASKERRLEAKKRQSQRKRERGAAE